MGVPGRMRSTLSDPLAGITRIAHRREVYE
jgi:hypothetical protein